jgi:DNA gyrase subunit A
LIKKTELMAYAHPRPSGIRAIGLEDHDEVIGVRLTDGQQELILSTAEGQSIRFKEEQVRPTGRGTFGVVGMRLDEGDHVVSMEILTRGFSVLTVADGGYGKRTEMDEYRLQSRGGKGIITMKTSERTGRVIGVQQSAGGPARAGRNIGKIIRLRIKDIRIIGRNTQGVRLSSSKANASCRWHRWRKKKKRTMAQAMRKSRRGTIERKIHEKSAAAGMRIR